MYQLNAMEIWHQRHEEMMREAENARLARRGRGYARAGLWGFWRRSWWQDLGS